MELAVGSVPVAVAAEIYGKNHWWVRAGIINGYLPIGYATKNGKVIQSLDEVKPRERINYYISPIKLYEHTGFAWKGETACQIREWKCQKLASIMSISTESTS